MKAYIVYILLLFAVKDACAQLKPVEDRSSIGFTIKNFGIRVTGAFSGITGAIQFDPAHPDQAKFDIDLNASTVNTDNNMRDEHLRGESYLDIKKYPKIHFVSTKVTPSNKSGMWLLTGQLTIKNHTKEVAFPFSATAATGGYQFKGAFQIKRKEFEVGGTSTISDEMDISLSVFAN